MLTRTKRRVAKVSVAILLAGALLTGCGSTEAPTNTASGSAAASASGDEKLTIGYVDFDTTLTTAEAFAIADKAAMEAIGWEVLMQDPKGDTAQANTICMQYVTRQADVIVINQYESSSMAQCMTAAQQANIPVFFLGGTLVEGAGMAGAISTTVPDPINEAFVNDVKNRENLQIFELTYNPGAPCRIREEKLDALIADAGLTDAVTKHEFRIPGQATDAQAAVQAWLNAHPASEKESLAVWSCGSDAAAGAIAGIRQAGRNGDIPVYTWDFTKQTVTLIQAGEMTATLWNDAEGMAQQLINMIKQYRVDTKPVGIEAAYQVITKDMIDQFLADHPDAAQ